jgi:hypothetical protein
LQLVVARVRKITLGLHDLVVGRHADVHLALRRLEPLLSQLAGDGARLHAFERALDGQRGVGHVGRDLKLKCFQVGLRLLQ